MHTGRKHQAAIHLWLCLDDTNLNFFLHFSHSNGGVSPVWILEWDLSCPGWLKALPHLSQMLTFSFLCTCLLWRFWDNPRQMYRGISHYQHVGLYNFLFCDGKWIPSHSKNTDKSCLQGDCVNVSNVKANCSEIGLSSVKKCMSGKACKLLFHCFFCICQSIPRRDFF